MATITLNYDARNTNLKKALDLVVCLGAKVVDKKPQKLNAIDESLEDIRCGRVYKANSVKDMINDILK